MGRPTRAFPQHDLQGQHSILFCTVASQEKEKMSRTAVLFIFAALFVAVSMAGDDGAVEKCRRRGQPVWQALPLPVRNVSDGDCLGFHRRCCYPWSRRLQDLQLAKA